MSDTTVRVLGRRWKQSGSSEDYTAYVTELVRSGSLNEEELRLHAYLGNSAAREAVRAEFDQDRWTPLVDFVRNWFCDELRVPDSLGSVRKRLGAVERRLGRAVPESTLR